MSKRSYMLRYFLILNIFRRRGELTFKEIKAYLKKEAGLHSNDDLEISKSTFDRNRNDISSIFHIDIDYDLKSSVYRIANFNNMEIKQHMLDAYDLFNSLNVPADLTQIIHIQTRFKSGIENLYSLIHAIKNRYIVKFAFQEFVNEIPTVQIMKPNVIKEFKGKWYLIGEVIEGSRRSFFDMGMITNLEITNKHFIFTDIDINMNFRDTYGISTWDDEISEKVVLSFIPEYGKYIKSFPIHPSQQIVKDTNEALVINLNLEPTEDFVCDLLSYGDSVTVISPEWLKDEVIQTLKGALKNYK